MYIFNHIDLDESKFIPADEHLIMYEVDPETTEPSDDCNCGCGGCCSKRKKTIVVALILASMLIGWLAFKKFA